MTILSPITVENGGLFISDATGTHPDRVIRSHELIFVRSGVLSMIEADRRFDVRAGQTLLLYPGRRHRGAEAYGPGVSFYWVHFHIIQQDASLAGQEGCHELELPQHATPARPDRMAELFHRFLDDQDSGRLTPLTASLLVQAMLAELTLPAIERSDAPAAAKVLAARAESYILSHLAETLSTSNVAAALEVNPDYLTRMFRASRGQTLTEFIHARRLREARTLLRETMLNLKQIADRCGFSDAAYLRRLFSRQEGLSPSAYRKLYMRVHINVR